LAFPPGSKTGVNPDITADNFADFGSDDAAAAMKKNRGGMSPRSPFIE
jgi:hypothetical protein